MAVSGKGDYPLRSAWGRGRGRGRGTALLRTPIQIASSIDAKKIIWTDWFFDGSAPPASTGQIKVYNGATFVAKPVKVYNGATFVTKPLKRYNGSIWVVTPY